MASSTLDQPFDGVSRHEPGVVEEKCRCSRRFHRLGAINPGYRENRCARCYCPERADQGFSVHFTSTVSNNRRPGFRRGSSDRRARFAHFADISIREFSPQRPHQQGTAIRIIVDDQKLELIRHTAKCAVTRLQRK